MKRIIYILLIALLLLTSCAKGDEVLKVAISQEPGDLDAQRNTALAVRVITVTNIYEKLLTINRNGLAVLELASEYQVSSDAKTITFKLRDNVLFHNGKLMKAEDVVASMNRWIDNYHAVHSIVGSARFVELDEHTVQIKADDPILLLVDIIANSPQAAVIMPKEVIEDLDENGLVKEYIGTGVYKFNKWVEGEYIELVKFDKYTPFGGKIVYGLSGQKQGNIETIRYYFEADRDKRAEGVESGKYHFANSIDSSLISSIQNDSSHKLFTRNEEGSFTIVFNKRSGVATDVAFRQAVNTGIDCDAIMKAGYGENGYILHPNYMESNSKKWIVEGLDEYYNQNDKEKAKEILSTSSYNGEVVTILTSNLTQIEKAARALQTELSLIGIESTLKVVSWEEFITIRNDESAYDMFVTQFLSVPIPSLKQFFCANYPGWISDTHLLDLLYDFIECTDKTQQQAIWSEIHHYSYEYLPAISVGHYQATAIWRDEIENVYTDFGFYFWNANFKK